jgi:hypothetical protein
MKRILGIGGEVLAILEVRIIENRRCYRLGLVLFLGPAAGVLAIEAPLRVRQVVQLFVGELRFVHMRSGFNGLMGRLTLPVGRGCERSVDLRRWDRLSGCAGLFGMEKGAPEDLPERLGYGFCEVRTQIRHEMDASNSASLLGRDGVGEGGFLIGVFGLGLEASALSLSGVEPVLAARSC